MTEELPFSKAKQTATSPNARCDRTGMLKRQCQCPRCLGSRNRRKGQRRQREVRKLMNLKGETWRGRTAHEETWDASNLRVEVKAGAQVKPIATRYVAARLQSDAARAIGDPRPFVFVAAPDGSQPLVVIRADELPAVVSALISEWTE